MSGQDKIASDLLLKEAAETLDMLTKAEFNNAAGDSSSASMEKVAELQSRMLSIEGSEKRAEDKLQQDLMLKHPPHKSHCLPCCDSNDDAETPFVIEPKPRSGSN